jgi:hypothetical protein
MSSNARRSGTGKSSSACPDQGRRWTPEVGGDVLALDDRLDESAYLGLRRRERACPDLLGLGCPLGGPVAVQVEALERRGDGDRHAVPVQDRALREDAIEVALDVVRGARDEEAGVLRVWLPRPVRVTHSHEEHAAVPVDVLAVQAVARLLVRVRPHARASEAPVPETRLGSVGIHPRHDVEGTCVECMPGAGVLGVQEVVDEVQRRGRSRELHGVDLRVHDHGGLLLRGPRLEVRDRAEPDVAPLVRRPDRLDLEERRELGRPRLERLGQLGVVVEAVEANAHRARA